MTIGQFSISAADWMATRVEERMALMSATPPPPGFDESSGTRVALSEQSGADNNDRRDRDRALLAAHETYKRVAQRIKARLASTPTERAPDDPPQSRKDDAPGRVQTDDPRKANDARARPDNEVEAFAARTRALVDPRNQDEERSEEIGGTRKGLWNDLFVDRLGSDTAPENPEPR